MLTPKRRLIAIIAAITTAALAGATIAIAASSGLVAQDRSLTVDLHAGQYGRYHVAFEEDGTIVARATVTLTQPSPICLPPPPGVLVKCDPPPPVMTSRDAPRPLRHERRR
jgi:hypothetical protein